MLSSYLSKETVESYAADEFYTHFYSLRSKPEKEAKEELAGALIKGGSSLYEACNKGPGSCAREPVTDSVKRL